MTSPLDDPQARSYLAALEDRLAQMHAEQSEEILTGIAEHITAASGPGGRTVHEVLTSLGTPEDVVAGAAAPWTTGYAPPPPVRAATNPPWQASTLWMAVTCILLPFGGFLAGVGWLFGVAGLWMGTRWKTWEKVVATVVLPGGLVGSLFLVTTGVWESDGSSSGTSSTPMGGSAPPVFEGSNPLLPSFPVVASIIALLLPLTVALYLLIVGIIRSPRKA